MEEFHVLAGPLHQHHESARKVRRISRRTVLVVDHARRLSFAGQPQHGFHEIIAEFRIEPCRTHDGSACTGRPHPFFTGQFRPAVNAHRPYGILLAVRPRSRPVEHVIGRYVKQPATIPHGERSEHRRPVRIDAFRRRFVALGPVHSRIGRTVDDCLRPALFHNGFHTFGIGDVAFRQVGKNETVRRIFRRYLPQRQAELAIRPGH